MAALEGWEWDAGNRELDVTVVEDGVYGCVTTFSLDGDEVERALGVADLRARAEAAEKRLAEVEADNALLTDACDRHAKANAGLLAQRDAMLAECATQLEKSRGTSETDLGRFWAAKAILASGQHEGE